MRRVVIAIAILAIVAGCKGKQQFVPPKVALAQQLAGNDKIVARVNGIPITQSQIKLIQEQFQDYTEKQALDFAIDQALLADEAVKQGLDSEFKVKFQYWRLLARALLKKKFEREFTKDSIPKETLVKIYWTPRVRAKYDHYDAFFVVDVQSICCPSGKRGCNKKHFKKCMEERKQIIEDVYNELKEHKFKTKSEFKKFVSENILGIYPNVSMQEYSFQYNLHAPHEEQKGYTIIDRAVALGAAKLKEKEISKPIASSFGWHILFLDKHLPEQHKTPDDPEVLEDIADTYFPLLQKQKAAKLIDDYLKKYDFQLNKDTIKEVEWARIVGAK